MNLTTAREKDAMEIYSALPYDIVKRIRQNMVSQDDVMDGKDSSDEFLGVAKILCLKLLDDNGEPKPAEKLIEDMIDKYWDLKKRVRRDILKVVKEAIGSDKNAESKVTTGKA